MNALHIIDVSRNRTGLPEGGATAVAEATLDDAGDRPSALPARDLLGPRVADLRADLAELRADFATLRADVRTEIAGLRPDMRSEFASVRRDVKADFASVRSEARAEFATVRAESRAEFASIGSQSRADVAALRSEIAELRTGLHQRLRAERMWLVGTMIAIAATALVIARFA